MVASVPSACASFTVRLMVPALTSVPVTSRTAVLTRTGAPWGYLAISWVPPSSSRL